MNLTRNELQVMDIFWNTAEPLSRAALLKKAEEQTWKPNSVHILINSLLKKGALREAGFTRSGKTYGRTFVAAMTCDQYYANTIVSSKTIPSIPGLLGALLDTADLSAEQLEEMEAVCRAKRESLSK